MTHCVLIPNKIAANNVDSFVRPVVSASPMDNGMVMQLKSKSGETGYEEVWVNTWPQTGSLCNLWMAMEHEVPFVTSGTNVINGIGTVRDFYISACTVFSAYKPQKGDIITMTSEAFESGTPPTDGQYAVAANEKWTLKASATTVGDDILTYRYLGTQKIPFGSGSAIGVQYITGYQLECIIA